MRDTPDFGRLTGLGMGGDVTIEGELIGGGIHYAEFEVLNVLLGFGDDEIVCGIVARVQRHRRFDLLLEAFARAAGEASIEGARALRHNDFKIPMMRNLVRRAVRSVA